MFLKLLVLKISMFRLFAAFIRTEILKKIKYFQNLELGYNNSRVQNP
jgi:hypothetical protein